MNKFLLGLISIAILSAEETKALQKAVLKQYKIFSVLMTLFITWFLQPALVIVMKIVMGK